MNFTTNYENVGSGSTLLPEGDYECIIKSAILNTTVNGTPYFDVRFVIRNDIQNQKYANKYIFHSIWKKKTPSEADNQVGGYSFAQIMALAKAAKIPAGKNYSSLDEMGKDLEKKPVLVTLEHNTYNNTTNERVKYVNESKFPDCKHVFKTTDNTGGQAQSYAQKPQQQFAAASAAVVPQAQTIGDLSDFEEVISDNDIPF